MENKADHEAEELHTKTFSVYRTGSEEPSKISQRKLYDQIMMHEVE